MSVMEPTDAARMVDYLVGYAEDDDERNPYGQSHVAEMLEEMAREDLEAVVYETIRRLANPSRDLGLLRSILRKLADGGGIYLDTYGPGRPDRVGDPCLGTDEYFMTDLTPAEAELFRAVVKEDAADDLG